MRVKSRLKDIVSYSKGSQINGDELLEYGKYDYLNGGILPSGKWNECNTDAKTVTISEGGNSCGYVNYMQEPFWCGAHCYYLFDEKVDKKYLYYILKSQQDRLMKLRSGACMPNIKKSDLGNFEVIYDTDVKKQQRIIDILDGVSLIISTRRRQLQKLDELLKARFVEVFGDPVSNPLSWEKKNLGEVCIKLNDGTHLSPESFETGDYKYVTAKNIKLSGFDFTNITYVPKEVHKRIYERCNPELGDVLYIKDGVTTGIAMVNTLEEEFTLLSSVALLKQDRRIMNGHFLAALLNNESMYIDIRSDMGGAAITRLTIAKLNAIKVILPPIELQNQFAKFVKQIDKTKLAVQQTLDKAQILFDSLMQKYFG